MAGSTSGFFRKVFNLAVLVAFVAAAAFVLINYYSYIFSKTVVGQVINLDRVTQPTLVMGTAAVNANNVLYSFAVAIRTPEGKIFTGSSEDRQWSIVNKGLCLEARFYPYPFWDLDKSGTYHNVRMVQLLDCPAGTPALPSTPTATEAPPVPVETAPANTAPAQPVPAQ